MDLDQTDIYWRIQQQNQEMEREMMGDNNGSGSGSNGGAFDPMEHVRASSSALDPSGFSGNFHLPRFASGGPAGSYGYGMAIAEPEMPREAFKSNYSTMLSSSGVSPSATSASFSSIYRPTIPSPAPLPASNDTSFRYDPTLSANTPVYTPYGSSIVSINPSAGSYKNPSLSLPPSNPSTVPFDPAALSLPVPPPAGTSTNFAGLYSSSGFDMLSVLARVAARPHQTIQIGPVDTSCAFLVVDARKWDMPIVFASETFTRMTGYTSQEIIGRNCRFLQSPDGITTQGSPRKYTDGNAAWHMRTHISAGKESQSSLINYMKGGKPFINLVTIVPITWDSEDIAYYVGFQVDLVDQPNAILDRMKDGTYVVNYSLLNAPPKSLEMATVELAEVEEVWTEEKPVVGRTGNLQLEVDGDEREVMETLGMLERGGLKSLETDADRKQLNKLLLDNSDDFIHVLSLKGSMLYCSPSTAQVLEYEPSELVGKTLSALCHPSDVVPVMRELKDSGSISHPIVTLLYRIRRKHSGYIWIEASGKLHIEPGKGRKCVILVGRPREVFKMSWNELRRAGGLGDVEFWTKLSPEGMVLSSTASVQTVLGFLPTEMVGTSIFQLVKADNVAEVRQALKMCAAGSAVTVRYQTKSRRGYVQVVTRFYPRHVDPLDSDMPVDYEVENNGPRHVSIIAQTNKVSSEERKHKKGTFLHEAPAYHSSGGSPMSESSTTSSAPRSAQSTFKTLSHPSVVSDNVFDELDTTRCTSWQYELHQLHNINKKLRDEKEHLLSLQRKRRSDFGQLALGGRRKDDSASSRASSNRGRSCANCGRTDSPEWRAGPTGVKSLCNACGLRWAKTQRSSASVSSAASVAAKSPPFSTSGSMESSASPVQWR